MNQKDWGFQWTFEREYLPRCEFLCIFVVKIYLLREDLSVFSEKIYTYILHDFIGEIAHVY